MKTRTYNGTLIWGLHATHYANSRRRDLYSFHTCCLLLFLFILTFTPGGTDPAYADGEPVTARFLNTSGEKITVKLKVSRPVPGSVIFTLSLPEGVKLLDAAPPAGKYDKEKGQVKWLLRGLSPGMHEIKLHFSAGIKADSLNAEIRYLNSATGKLCILPVSE